MLYRPDRDADSGGAGVHRASLGRLSEGDTRPRSRGRQICTRARSRLCLDHARFQPNCQAKRVVTSWLAERYDTEHAVRRGTPPGESTWSAGRAQTSHPKWRWRWT